VVALPRLQKGVYAMTINAFQNIVVRLANGRHTRYWLNWSGRPYTVMAVQCIDGTGKPEAIKDAESHGLQESFDLVYTVRRTNEDGTPYVDPADIELVRQFPPEHSVKGDLGSVPLC
jgi:hypothetical protein